MSKFNNFKNYNPDILETIANLSNDEVFTPPKLANEILDLLPEEVWSNPNLTFLDPAVKTGIFLREIASRLIDGLADQIPDLQERVNHILTKQVFGIGITELTTLMSRRTVYCSMTANGKFSIVTEFDDEKGNIIFPDTEHTWDKNGRCEYCGANKDSYGDGADRENYAYPFIHDNFEKEFGNMKFDVIIGNPPYQLDDESEGSNSASAIYHLFIDKSIELNPKYITMITPSRWMTGTAKGINREWVKKTLNDKRLSKMIDYEISESIFPSVSVNGGVNYFLWDSENNKEMQYTFKAQDGTSKSKTGEMDRFKIGTVIRDIRIHSIIDKIREIEGSSYFKNKESFMNIVSSGNGFTGEGKVFWSNWKGYSKEKVKDNDIKYYVNKATHGVDFGWIKNEEVKGNRKSIENHKIIIARSHGGKRRVLSTPRYSEPNSIPSGTYLTIGRDNKFNQEECNNLISYIKTKFFRALVSAKKQTQNGPRGVYQFVPLQDFSKPWTDEELYKKYKLTQEEIDYIEENIDPMSSSDD